MAPEEFEHDLLREAEGLDFLSKLFQGFDNLLAECLEEQGDFLDPGLIVCLEIVRYEINITLSGVVTLEELGKVPGILKQLEVCQDEIQTLQAGLPTKHGITDED